MALSLITSLIDKIESADKQTDSEDKKCFKPTIDNRRNADLLSCGYLRSISGKHQDVQDILNLIISYVMSNILIWKNDMNGNLENIKLEHISLYFRTGGENMMMITKEKSLYSVGRNSFHQMCVVNSSKPIYFAEICSPIKSNCFQNQFITIISEGVYGNHNFVVIENGDIYGVGCNENGELGIGTMTEMESTPIKININMCAKESIELIRCGGHFSIILSVSTFNNIWVTGQNNIGQLGLGDTNDRNTFFLNESFKNIQCMDVECGINSSYIIDNEYNVWVFGCYELGRLGLGENINSHQLNPVKIEYFIEQNIDIVQLSCGDRHVCCLSNDYKVYTFGHNRYGQIGNNSTDNAFLPYHISIENGDNIVKVECGSGSTLLLDNKNNLYVFGCNEWGDLLLSPKEYGKKLLKPHFISFETLKTKMKDDNITTIMDVKAAAACFVITD
eukprot:345356_1